METDIDYLMIYNHTLVRFLSYNHFIFPTNSNRYNVFWVHTCKDIKLKYENRPPFTTKHQNRLKGNAVVTKSPSPPPLPPPNTFISPLASNIDENARDRKHKNVVEARKTQGAKDKQYLNPSKMAVTKNQLGKENSSNKVKVPPKYSMAKGSESTKGHKSKIRLPYDTEFCCDDDKFHLLGLEAAKKDSVSILWISTLILNL